MVITVWRFIVPGCFNLLLSAFLQGGIKPIISGIRTAPGELSIAAAIISVTNVGFVVSLLKVDPAKALLLISLNPLWAALLGYTFLGDKLERRTVIAQIAALISVCLVFVPNALQMMTQTFLVLEAETDESDESAEELYDLESRRPFTLPQPIDRSAVIVVRIACSGATGDGLLDRRLPHVLSLLLFTRSLQCFSRSTHHALPTTHNLHRLPPTTTYHPLTTHYHLLHTFIILGLRRHRPRHRRYLHRWY